MKFPVVYFTAGIFAKVGERRNTPERKQQTKKFRRAKFSQKFDCKNDKTKTSAEVTRLVRRGKHKHNNNENNILVSRRKLKVG